MTTSHRFSRQLFLATTLISALANVIQPKTSHAQRKQPMQLELTSPAFQDGQPIPPTYTADGSNTSPPLKWNEPPKGTKSLALICEDPDAPKATFTHWVVFNIPVESRELSEGVPQEQELANGTVQGRNDMAHIGYVGPSPPRGKPHHYQFELFALDAPLELPPGASGKDLKAAISSHVLAEGRLTGMYGRK